MAVALQNPDQTDEEYALVRLRYQTRREAEYMGYQAKCLRERMEKVQRGLLYLAVIKHLADQQEKELQDVFCCWLMKLYLDEETKQIGDRLNLN